MFQSELSYQNERRSAGATQALTYHADINEDTQLHGPKEGATSRAENDPKLTRKEKLKQQEIAQPNFYGARVLFDFNEHFIELSNGHEEKRSLALIVLALLSLVMGFLLSVSVRLIFSSAPAWVLAAMFSMFLAVFALFYFLFWNHFLTSTFFTSLRARYRFNRTTGKVYALRPKKFGGNVVLDWSRVQAHVNWRPPKSWTAEQLATSEVARKQRAQSDGSDSCLVLYWPPLDAKDPKRNGEDVLWVGPSGSGEPLWQYIRTFMEEGMHAVPQPSERNWLRKGFSGPGEHLEETVMHGSHQRDDLMGGGTSGATFGNYATNFLWAPLHSLAERLCYWPTFPQEWSSDCGQQRREDGLGPEEPLRWSAKV